MTLMLPSGNRSRRSIEPVKWICSSGCDGDCQTTGCCVVADTERELGGQRRGAVVPLGLEPATQRGHDLGAAGTPHLRMAEAMVGQPQLGLLIENLAGPDQYRLEIVGGVDPRTVELRMRLDELLQQALEDTMHQRALVARLDVDDVGWIVVVGPRAQHPGDEVLGAALHPLLERRDARLGANALGGGSGERVEVVQRSDLSVELGLMWLTPRADRPTAAIETRFGAVDVTAEPLVGVEPRVRGVGDLRGMRGHVLLDDVVGGHEWRRVHGTAGAHVPARVQHGDAVGGPVERGQETATVAHRTVAGPGEHAERFGTERAGQHQIVGHPSWQQTVVGPDHEDVVVHRAAGADQLVDHHTGTLALGTDDVVVEERGDQPRRGASAAVQPEAHRAGRASRTRLRLVRQRRAASWRHPSSCRGATRPCRSAT